MDDEAMVFRDGGLGWEEASTDPTDPPSEASEEASSTDPPSEASTDPPSSSSSFSGSSTSSSATSASAATIATVPTEDLYRAVRCRRAFTARSAPPSSASSPRSSSSPSRAFGFEPRSVRFPTSTPRISSATTLATSPFAPVPARAAMATRRAKCDPPPTARASTSASVTVTSTNRAKPFTNCQVAKLYPDPRRRPEPESRGVGEDAGEGVEFRFSSASFRFSSASFRFSSASFRFSSASFRFSSASSASSPARSASRNATRTPATRTGMLRCIIAAADAAAPRVDDVSSPVCCLAVAAVRFPLAVLRRPTPFREGGESAALGFHPAPYPTPAAHVGEVGSTSRSASGNAARQLGLDERAVEGAVAAEVSRVRFPAKFPGFAPADSAPRLWNPEDWRRRVARAALPGAPPRKLPSRDSSGLVASPGRRSRRERPRRRLLTNSASHAKRVKIWPVYRTSSISRDATAPRSKVTSTSLTCRNPTAPTVMPMPRLPKTRTWETRTRTRRGQGGEKEGVAKEVVASGDA